MASQQTRDELKLHHPLALEKSDLRVKMHIIVTNGYGRVYYEGKVSYVSDTEIWLTPIVGLGKMESLSNLGFPTHDGSAESKYVYDNNTFFAFKATWRIRLKYRQERRRFKNRLTRGRKV